MAIRQRFNYPTRSHEAGLASRALALLIAEKYPNKETRKKDQQGDIPDIDGRIRQYRSQVNTRLQKKPQAGH